MTEMAEKSWDHSMDVHGGHAFKQGLERISFAYTAAPIGVTVEGEIYLTRNLIIFWTGSDTLPSLYFTRNSIIDRRRCRKKLTSTNRTLLSHIGYVISNVVRCAVSGLTGGHCVFQPVRGLPPVIIDN